MRHTNKMFIRFLKNFLRCGLTGWCLEILFTACGSIKNQDFRLTGTTSLWMFPIYGSAAFLNPLFHLLRRRPILLRGIVYMLLIFAGEYISGTILARHNLCPWDYSQSKFNIQSVIRLDYAPYWFGTGLLFEHLICPTQVRDGTLRIPSHSTRKS